MKSKVSILWVAFAFFSQSVAAQHDFGIMSLKKNLWEEALVYEKGQYNSLPLSEVLTGNAIYFRVEPVSYSGDYLLLKSHRAFDFFINGKLADAGLTNRVYSMDSLKALYPSPWLVAIYQKKFFKEDMKVEIRTLNNVPVVKENTPRIDATQLRDFAVVALFILLILLVSIIQLNPKLASDYFSLNKIFSLRESDDSQIYNRISNSTNILVYIFCSLAAGFCFLLIFHFTVPVFTNGLNFQSSNFFMQVVHWLTISAILLGIFLLKMFLVYIVSTLFGLREVASLQFFNWVRIVLVTFCCITLVLSVYFISRGQASAFYSMLIALIVIMLTAALLVIFLKLNGKGEYSIFHLFSYICATEIIPLFLMIKVLYQ